jgi:hypothetical protein
VVAHTYNPRSLGGGDMRTMVWGQSGQKLLRFSLKTKLGLVVQMCNHCYSGSADRRVTVWGLPKTKVKVNKKPTVGFHVKMVDIVCGGGPD